MTDPVAHVYHIRDRPDLLADVMDLGRKNSATVGFFPRGAFEDHAAKGLVFVSVVDGELGGYVLYRVVRDKATVVHLCVSDAHRGRGVARGLFERLVSETQELKGIDLLCRQDFEANAVWPVLGFRFVETVPGRGKERSPLARWWFDQGGANLFTHASAGLTDVVVDANVFFDIVEEGDHRPNAEESLGLVADWLAPHFRVLVSDEIDNESLRNADAESAERTRRAARELGKLERNGAAFIEKLGRLQTVLPPRAMSRERDLSDLRHIASAASAGVAYFATRDERLLGASADILDSVGVEVLRPVQFISKLDEIHGEAGPQPARLAGSRLEVAPVGKYDEAEVTAFYSNATGERRSRYLRLARGYLAHPDRYAVETVTADGVPLALLVTDRDEPGVVRVPMLRLTAHPGALALAQALLFRTVKEAAEARASFVAVDEPLLTPDVAAMMGRWGFFEDDNRYVKVVVAESGDRSALQGRLSQILESRRFPYVSRSLLDVARTAHPADTETLASLEAAVWPSKILDAGVPTFVVPIKPHWAHNLFDDRLAERTLFGAPEHLALSREGVYFRAKRNGGGLAAPGRVLWYVSAGGRKYPGSGALRACSTIESVDVAPAADLFRRHRRLGTYAWSDIVGTTGGDKNKEMMAVRFTDTILFQNPIPYERLQPIVRAFDVRTTFQSPRPIGSELFTALFTEAHPLPHRGSPRRTDRPALDPAPVRRPH